MIFVATMSDHEVSVLFIAKCKTQPIHFQLNVHSAKEVVYNFISCLDSKGLLKGLQIYDAKIKFSLKSLLDA